MDVQVSKEAARKLVEMMEEVKAGFKTIYGTDLDVNVENIILNGAQTQLYFNGESKNGYKFTRDFMVEKVANFYKN